MWPDSQADRNSRSRCQEIAEEAADRLHNDPHVNHSNVSCYCEDRVLWLRGELPSFYAKQVAQEAVKGVEGIVGVMNDIEVTW